MIRVSIIIPVYNVSDYIIRCINSVINQTYTEIECILVDDCSLDNSVELLEQRLQSYNGSIEFKIIRQQQNKGVSEARNIGIKNATGDYLYFIDSDDEITNDCIDTLVGLCKNSEQMAIGSYIIPNTTSDNPIKLKEPLYNNEDILQTYLSCYWHEMPWNKLVQRDFIIRNNLFFFPNLKHHQDALWSFHVVSKLESLTFTNKITYIYYVRPESLNTTFDLKRANEMLLILDEIIKTSRTLPYNVSNYIVTLAMGTVDNIYYKLLVPLSKQKLLYGYVKNIKSIISRYPIHNLDKEPKKRLFMIKHPLLCDIFYRYGHHKIISLIFRYLIFINK